jgi:hypothetical protein
MKPDDETTYSLWNGATDLGIVLTSDSTAYTMGTKFKVSSAGHLLGAAFYSAAGAEELPDTIALFLASDESVVASNAASWSGATGSGWVQANFTSPVALTSETKYKIAVLQSIDGGGNWYSGTHGYWTTTSIDNGPLHGFSAAEEPADQGTYTGDTILAYPDTDFLDSNYWVDPIVQVP